MRGMDEQRIRTILRRKVASSTQAAIADEIGCSGAYLSDFLNGKRTAGSKIQKYLGIERRVTYHKATNGASNGR